MIITGAKVFTPDFRFEEKTIYIENGMFAASAAPKGEQEMLAADGLYALPGLVDIHFHGAVGYDFCSASVEQLTAIAKYEAANGITAICPATMTYPEETLNHAADTAVRFAELEKDVHLKSNFPEIAAAADLVGINMEGPFISPHKLGAQNPEYVQRPDAQMVRRLQKRSGNLIRLIDIAPEAEGAMDFIEEMKEEAVISLAHSTASYELACEAFRRGASHITHLFDAMPDIGHREPGPAIAALENGIEVELIADGIHIHPAIVRFVFRTFGADKVILIADSMEATGLPDGQYQLGGQDVTKRGSLAVLTEHPDVIAGSVTNLYDCMKNAVQNMNVPFADALRAATINPARSIGIDDQYGSIEPGKKADVILTDAALNIQYVIKDGRIITGQTNGRNIT